MDKCISKPEILNLKQCNFNNYKNDLLISDNKLLDFYGFVFKAENSKIMVAMLTPYQGVFGKMI